MSRRRESLASLALAAVIATGLALVLVAWVDETLAGPQVLAHAALAAVPVGTWWQRLVVQWRLRMARKELLYTLDEVAWLQEDIEERLPLDLARYRRHAELIRARIRRLEEQEAEL